MVEYRDWLGTRYWSEREGHEIRYIVIHDTEGPRDAALAWWQSSTNPYQSSAHDLIDAEGIVWRCVPYDKAAHHAGGSHIPGFNQLNAATGAYEPNANLASIGVELEYPAAPASPPWPQVQLDAAVEHVRTLVQTYQVPRANIYRHADIDPERRTDPRNFAWDEFLDLVFRTGEDDVAHALRQAAWSAGGIPYDPEAPFAAYARAHNLGHPETPEFDFTFAGQAYRGQGFGKAIVYAPLGDWEHIKEVPW